MSRTFAQINCSLLGSKRLAQCNHAERWAYTCAHLTPLGNYLGLFRYPLVMWAQDAAIPAGDVAGTVERLTNLGLVEFDPDEELVRIVRFHRQRPPDNGSRVISLVTDFRDGFPSLDPGAAIRVKAIAEFAVATVQRAHGWKPDSTDREKVRDTLRPFLLHEWQEGGDALVAAVRSELASAPQAARKEMQTYFPSVELAGPADTVPAPCGHRGRTRDVDETRRIQDENEDLDDTADNSRCVSSQAVVQAKRPVRLRNGAGGKRSASMPGPLPETRNSRLAKGA